MVTKNIAGYTFEDVVSNMKRMIDESLLDSRVRDLAIEITSGHDDKIAAIYDWTKENIKYIPDPTNIELLTSPIRMVNDYREGKSLGEDCDGHALFVVALLRSVGIDSHVAILDVEGSGWDHASAVAHSDKLGKEIFVDTTSSKPLGWTEKYIKRYDVI